MRFFVTFIILGICLVFIQTTLAGSKKRRDSREVVSEYKDKNYGEAPKKSKYQKVEVQENKPRKQYKKQKQQQQPAYDSAESEEELVYVPKKNQKQSFKKAKAAKQPRTVEAYEETYEVVDRAPKKYKKQMENVEETNTYVKKQKKRSVPSAEAPKIKYNKKKNVESECNCKCGEVVPNRSYKKSQNNKIQENQVEEDAGIDNEDSDVDLTDVDGGDTEVVEDGEGNADLYCHTNNDSDCDVPSL